MAERKQRKILRISEWLLSEEQCKDTEGQKGEAFNSWPRVNGRNNISNSLLLFNSPSFMSMNRWLGIRLEKKEPIHTEYYI